MVAVLSATHYTRQRPPLGKTKTPFVCHYFSLISNSSFQTFRLYSFSLFSRLTLRLSSLPLSPTQLSILSDCHQKVFSSRGFYCFDRVAFKGSLRYEFGQRRKNKAEGEVGVKAMAKKVNPPSSKLEGLDDEMKKIIDANMDEAEARRRARDAFKDIQLGIDHCLFKIPTDGLKMEETYVVNSRGLKIFTRSWIPELSPPKAAICYCHGYGDTCTFFFEGIARKLASSGFAVFAMDYPGFGLSDGLHGYIPSFDRLVDDVVEHYSKVKENPDFRNLRFFLFGQSMGGAVALKIHLKQPNSWDGAVLVAPMCKIADDMYPPWILTKLLIGVAKVLPESKLVPERDLAERAFREPLKREQTSYNVIAYKDKPRLQTAVQLLNTTNEIECRLGDVSLPLLILHGEDDVVTDPSVSKALYEKASSKDKKINLYAGGYHALLEGEPDEMIHQVFKDIVSWLDERVLK